jgi:hypothetical protein
MKGTEEARVEEKGTGQEGAEANVQERREHEEMDLESRVQEKREGERRGQ